MPSHSTPCGNFQENLFGGACKVCGFGRFQCLGAARNATTKAPDSQKSIARTPSPEFQGEISAQYHGSDLDEHDNSVTTSEERPPRFWLTTKEVTNLKPKPRSPRPTHRPPSASRSKPLSDPYVPSPSRRQTTRAARKSSRNDSSMVMYNGTVLLGTRNTSGHGSQASRVLLDRDHGGGSHTRGRTKVRPNHSRRENDVSALPKTVALAAQKSYREHRRDEFENESEAIELETERWLESKAQRLFDLSTKAEDLRSAKATSAQLVEGPRWPHTDPAVQQSLARSTRSDFPGGNFSHDFHSVRGDHGGHAYHTATNLGSTRPW
eukprot:UC4_evm6s426